MQDNLNTREPASLYEALPPPGAWARQTFSWHCTPDRRCGWLDMAESELSVLSRQCLDRRIANKQTLIEEVAAWQDDRNKHHAEADLAVLTTAENALS